MGRELKRVALNFTAPLDQPWQGYQNPHYTATDCPHCGGTGSSPLARHLGAQWYGNAPFSPADNGSTAFAPKHPAIVAFAQRNLAAAPEFYGHGHLAMERECMRLANHFNRGWSHHLNDADVMALLAAGRLMDFSHTWTPGTGWVRKVPAYVPTALEVNVWSIGGMGHDSINQWVCVRAACARAGQAAECRHCEGEGNLWPSQADKERYDAWERIEPPAGEGFQIWQTVSDGPISPVFATAEELAHYMAGRPRGSDDGSSYDTWLSFILGPGWAPSMVGGPDGLISGPAAAFHGQ